jgi:hypothetical protein
MKRLIVGLVGLTALAVGVYWFLPATQPNMVPKPEPSLSPETAARVYRDLQLAIAHLENLKPEPAIAILIGLEKDLPNEKAIRQNLAIGRMLAAMNPQKDANAELLKQAAITELQKLKTVRPGDWEGAALLGLFLESLDDYSGAFQEYAGVAPLEEAPQRTAPTGEPALLYAMARTGLKLPDGPQRAEAKRALLKAVERQPDDLWLLLALMEEQVAHKDPEITKTIEKLLAVAPLVAEPIKRAQRFDILKSIDSLKEAIARDDWKVAPRFWGPVKNLVTPADASQSDRKRNDRHPLDYVVDQIEGIAVPEDASSSPIPIQFGPMTLPDPYVDLSVAVDVRWADLTFDRIPELCVLESARLAVWSRGPGQTWTLAAECPVEGATTLQVADLDDDAAELPLSATPGVSGDAVKRADLDFVLSGPKGIQLVKTELVEGAPKLTPWPAENSVALGDNVQCSAHADFDGDGDLDLLVAGPTGLKLGFNTGRPTFELRPDTPAMVPADVAITQLKPVDIDRDHDIDVLVVAAGKLALLTNLRHGTLRWTEVPGYDNLAIVNHVNVFDSDSNGSWDLLVSGPAGQSVVLGRTLEEGDWRATSVKSVHTQPVLSATLADLDNDGREDQIRAGKSFSFGRNLKSGFEELSWGHPGNPLTRSAQAIDADGDGDLDVCRKLEQGFELLENNGGNQNAWISIEVVAAQIKDSPPVQSGRVNHYGIGCLLESRTTAGYQARVVDSHPAHFGLGPVGKADIVRIVWQNGSPVNMIGPAVNATVWEIQTLTGSCPYLYTWDGEKYVFATDLLWAAPLGMPSPAGGLTPAREWEYLKIPGSILKERDGLYSLQLTEELYEAAYFDKVQLIAVDHPADVEVYSNEKVGPPSIAEKKIHTVQQPRLPVSAQDQQGRDLLPALSQLDEVYTKHWDHKIKQGWTEKTTLEIDLGAVPEAAKTTLFLTGWIYPTDPAISVSIQQDPVRAGFGIQPPSLEVPDGQGGWKTASPFIGFPGGKTKTIAVDLTGMLTPGDPRVRLVTSMELCWDQIFFTVDEPAAEVRETPLELVSADLHFRGCSARVIHPQHGPERYDYSRVDRMIYSSMEGRFTRYGDVQELLTAQDDRMVILGCGDECTLTFRVPEPPPVGWTRDFLIHNVGWDKDCNPQNVYGKTVEPLPFATMQSYPPAEAFPEDEKHQEYLRKYQTREQDDISFRRYLFVGEQ